MTQSILSKFENISLDKKDCSQLTVKAEIEIDFFEKRIAIFILLIEIILHITKVNYILFKDIT